MVRQFQIAHRVRKNAEQPPETPANPPGAPPRKHAPHTAGKQNAGAPGGAPQQNPTTKESRGGRKGLAPGIAPGPIPPVKRPHTTVWRQTRVRERSEVMTLHRRPVAALTNLSYTSKLQPVSNCTKCPRQDSNLRPAGLQPAALTKLSYRGFILRAPGGTRTRNLPHRKRALYPLSYGSKTRYSTISCPRQESNLCAPGFNRKLYRLSYKGENTI